MIMKFFIRRNNLKIRSCFLGDTLTQFFDKIIFEHYFNKYNALNFGIYGNKIKRVIFKIKNGMFDF